MDIKEIIKEALSTLLVNKLRTALASLGIIIGIGSVITLLSLGEGTQKQVESQIQSLGSNLLTVTPGAENSRNNVRSAGGSRTTLTYADSLAIEQSPSVTSVSLVAPIYTGRSQVVYGRNNSNTQIYGVTPNYSKVRDISLSSGTFVSQRDVDAQSNVAVLGPQVVNDLFGEASTPIGEIIRIDGKAFKIIGIADSKGGSGFFNQDDIVYIPLTTAQRTLFGANYLSSIYLEAKNAKVMTQAQDEVGYLLLSRHKIADPASADFSVLSQSDILQTASSVTGTFTALLSGIAAISLVVGGIGIMNIMLVTVTERTREIGLRKALGAKKKAIVTQFLVESLILTASGGLIGMIIGISASYLISMFMSFPFTVSLKSVVLAIGVSGAIGVIFGWYPAKKASDLQPIEALRYE